MDESQVQVVTYETNGLTGHMTIHVRLVTSTRQGPVRSYGIDPTSLQTIYGGDLDRWLAAVKAEHKQFVGVSDQISTRLASLKGRML